MRFEYTLISYKSNSYPLYTLWSLLEIFLVKDGYILLSLKEKI